MGRKKASFRGTWYPGSRDECESHIKSYLTDKNGIIKGDFQGCVVPHAGWYYSGSIACRTIASLATQNKKKNIDCVVICGLHMHQKDSSCLFGSGSWETPFGDIDIDEDFGSGIVEKAEAEQVKIVKESYHSFPTENTIELQLPFVKYFFKKTPVVPIGVPPSQDAIQLGIAVHNAAKDLGLDIVVVGSTDLTHYGQSFGFTPAGRGEKSFEWVKNDNDANAVSAIISMDAEHIINNGNVKQNMCCAGAAAATATICKKLGSKKGIEVEYDSSYNKSPGESFVGYTGVLFST
jgi:AmmeMemoRadiSam system protein B